MSKIPSLYAFTDIPVVPNPAKGIRFAQASWAYQDFVPTKPRPKSNFKAKVHHMTEKVHGIDVSTNIR